MAEWKIILGTEHLKMCFRHKKFDHCEIIAFLTNATLDEYFTSFSCADKHKTVQSRHTDEISSKSSSSPPVG